MHLKNVFPHKLNLHVNTYKSYKLDEIGKFRMTHVQIWMKKV